MGYITFMRQFRQLDVVTKSIVYGNNYICLHEEDRSSCKFSIFFCSNFCKGRIRSHFRFKSGYPHGHSTEKIQTLIKIGFSENIFPLFYHSKLITYFKLIFLKIIFQKKHLLTVFVVVFPSLLELVCIPNVSPK